MPTSYGVCNEFIIFGFMRGTPKFLETYKLPRLNQEVENLNRPVTSRNWIVKHNILTTKSPRPDDLIGEFYRHLNNTNPS